MSDVRQHHHTEYAVVRYNITGWWGAFAENAPPVRGLWNGGSVPDRSWLAAVLTVPLVAACGGDSSSVMSLSPGWEDAVTACVLADVIGQVTLVEPEGTNLAKVRQMLDTLPASSSAAAAASPTYATLDRLVQTFVTSWDGVELQAVDDLVAVVEECSRLGLSPADYGHTRRYPPLG